MKEYSIEADASDILDEVYRLTAKAAVQRGDAIRVATSDDEDIISQFINDGKRLLEKALGRYSTGALKYSMPDNWPDRSEDVNEQSKLFLKNYTVAKWYELSDTGDKYIVMANEALEIIAKIMDKRNKT